MFRADNSFNVLIGKSISRTASVQAFDRTIASTFIANGEVVALDKDGVELTPGKTIQDSEFIYLAQGRGSTNPVVLSNKIYGSTVTNYSGTSYSAPAEQVAYVGYNGTTGNIEALSNNKYKLRIIFKYDTANWSQQVNTNYNEVDSDASATSQEVAAAFVKKFNTFYPSSNADIKVERVADGTFAVAGGATTADVVNGSPTVTFSGVGHNFAAGDIIRIGASTTDTPVYLVSSVSGAVVTLDSNYTGATATVANANIGELSGTLNWGLKITGKPLTFAVATFKYLKVMFDITISGFGTTAITDSQAVSRGNGTYEEVAELEYFARGFDGWLAARNSVPAVPQPTTDATSGAIYDMIRIRAFDNTDFGVISGTKPAPFGIYIAMVEGAAQTTNLLAQLNPWMASTPRAFAAVSV